MSILKPLCVALAIVLSLTTAGQSQDLATLAQKEKERQAKARAEGSEAKVYTGSGSSATADPSASPDPPDATTPPAGKGAEAARANGGSRSGGARNRASVSPAETGRSARSYRTVNVTIYVTSWCGYCRKARAFLATQPNVNVVAHDIEQSKARRAEMVAKAGGNTGVPVIDIEGIVLQGFSEPSITNALDTIRNR
jgi:glutaredoxin